jgi:hypothetical protein
VPPWIAPRIEQSAPVPVQLERFAAPDRAKCKSARPGEPRRSAHAARVLDGTATATGDRMLDLVFLLVTIAFFVVAAAYARACDRL